MSASAQLNRNSGPPRRSARIKNIHMISDEDSDGDSLSLNLKHVKIEVPDLDEILSPSTSPVDVASVSDKDAELDLHDISLKDLRARCKAKNREASKITSDGPDVEHEAQSWSIEDDKTREEFDFDKPLIALKQKRQRTSPSKANKKIDVLISPLCAVKEEDTTSEGNQTPAEQISILEAAMHDSVTAKLETRPTDSEHSTIADDCTAEIAGEEGCCSEAETPVQPLVNCEKSDTGDIYSEEAGTFCHVSLSSPDRNCFEYSPVDLQQEQEEYDRCKPQPCFINQLTESAHVSDHSCELISSTKACNFDDDDAEKVTNIVSPLDLIDEVSDHHKTPENISNSDTDRYSTGNGFSACFINQSCDDYIQDVGYWNTEVVEGNEPESATVSEELSPINESNTDIGSPLVAIQSDLCGSIDTKSTSLEEVVQMQRNSQLHTTAFCDVRSKQIVQDTEIKQGTTNHAFVFDKTHDLSPPANFAKQDGRLESIVYEVLNNHMQKMTSENTSVAGGLPDTAVIHSPDFTDNFPGDEISLPSYAEQSLKNMHSLNSRVDYGICTSISNDGSVEVQAHLFGACVNKETASRVPSEISISEETQEMLAGAPHSSATSLESENQNLKTDIFYEEPIEEHGPKKLFLKRKIMSPTSQEKLCNALTGIDLCGVKRQKSDIIVEDREKSKTLLPQPSYNQERSTFCTDRRLRGRMSISPTSKEVRKSGENPSYQQATCSCKKSSPVVLDTEKAVEFSQRQMQDIENIAAKLMRSLKNMKSIVDETLSSEAYSVVPKNIAEIRAASEDASEVEKTTRKWLTIMNKDCNRFCKILTLAKNDVSAQQAPRKQRKITFADEAGGKLCHIKLFKDGNTCLSECQ